jgi:hypothetical protein
MVIKQVYCTNASMKSYIEINHLAIVERNGTLQPASQFGSLAREFARQNSGVPFFQSTWTTLGLLTKSDGTCGAWMQFAFDVFATQHILVDRTGIVLNSNLNNITCFELKSSVTGQGGVTPRESIWGDHATIAYQGKMYDPSYGQAYGYLVNDAFQEFINNIESVGYLKGGAPSGYAAIYVDVRNPLITDFVIGVSEGKPVIP